MFWLGLGTITQRGQNEKPYGVIHLWAKAQRVLTPFSLKNEIYLGKFNSCSC